MNAIVNYLIEANFLLIVLFAGYRLLLSNETHFSFNRTYLLAGIALSLLLPLMHFHLPSGERVIPSLDHFVPAYWLPEISITGYGNGEHAAAGNSFEIWSVLAWIYSIGLFIFLLLFLVRLTRVVRLLRQSIHYPWNTCRVTESDDEKPTFSFFNFIFLGQARHLSADEKEEILHHEWIHVRKFHSLDLILIHVVQAVFWFNPLVGMYRRALVELHEFEADARAVEGGNIDRYSRLLAKVALQSNGLTLVNHFNQSLTLKRITMMKAMKKKIQGWKLVVLTAVMPLLFVAVACQDQVSDLQNINKNSATTSVIPTEVQARLNQLQSENPGKEFIVILLNDDGKKTLDKITAETSTDQIYVSGSEPDAKVSTDHIYVSGSAAKAENSSDRYKVSGSETEAKIAQDNFYHSAVVTTSSTSDGKGFSYVILEKRSAIRITGLAVRPDNVFNVSDEAPSYVGGMNAMIEYITRELKYPEKAMKAGIEGKVFVSFVITKDGSVTQLTTMKGIDPDCDQEAMRVVAGFPKWMPGKNNGEAVNVRFVLPISFKLGPKSPETQNAKQ